ncbi:amidohydrolase [Mycobacterium pyrenivorans]|nr:amidohydrolase family protein [Mycolicibacterium pyrenivorans]MCV7150127.1 amidohydrolase [Mycolicibacterium pyrenivorans]
MYKLGFPVFDADNHMYETPDAVSRHLPKEYDGAVEFIQVRGRTRLAVNGKIVHYIPNPTFERVARPGAHIDFYAGTNTDGRTIRQMTGEPIATPDSFRRPDARLKLLDEQGVQNALVYPTLANLVEQSAMDDPELVHALVHALNRWMAEEWTFDYEERIFATPVIALPLVDEAVRELEWVLERGARAILIRPAPVNGLRGYRSPALPEFDPFWRRVEEANIPVLVHATFTILGDYVKMWEPGNHQNPFKENAFRNLVAGHRDIHDLIGSFICHGTFTRFPRLRMASVENGTDWVRPLLHDLAHIYGQMPQMFEEEPLKVFDRNVWVSPFWETDINELLKIVSPDKLLFGSDYPHPEGLADPLSYYDYVKDQDPAVIQKVMSGNAYDLVGMHAPISA